MLLNCSIKEKRKQNDVSLYMQADDMTLQTNTEYEI